MYLNRGILTFNMRLIFFRFIWLDKVNNNYAYAYLVIYFEWIYLLTLSSTLSVIAFWDTV